MNISIHNYLPTYTQLESWQQDKYSIPLELARLHYCRCTSLPKELHSPLSSVNLLALYHSGLLSQS